MTDHVLSIVLGLVGGLLPGGLRFAFTLRRGKKVESGTIDLTAYTTRRP
ncbi:MAG: hypothetical protein ACJ786_36190 [Catenulispora sp.]|jgi:hypothetical protein